jgi:farnesyl-diphosphate farnesyltransferase
LPAERLLLERIEGILGCLAALDSDDRQRIREVLTVITSGQELDLRRFHGASVERIVALTTDAELDDYTYRVAGCVGEFWTKMCLAHLFRAAAVPEAEFLALAVRFGKGLQLVNILRDLPRDLCQGRCYVPQELLAVQRLDSTDLLKVETEARFRPVYNPLLNLAEAHLAAGWAYTNALPRGQYRLRLACAWPILIGARTLELLRTGNPLDSTRRIKVARAEVYQIILGSILRLPFAAKWQQQFRWAK